MNCVFFDPANGQVFTLRAGGAMGVNVKTLSTRLTNNFRIQDKGNVLSVKFNPTCSVLSLQRTRNCVDFINFINNHPDDDEYSQICRKSASQILGYVWAKEDEIIFVTNEGFELFQILMEKRHLRLVKQGTVLTNWYTWDPLNKILLLSSGDLANHLNVISFEDVPTKLSCFEVPVESLPPVTIDSASGINEGPCKLLQKNCLLANLYGQLYACILSKNTDGAIELALYKLMRGGPVKKVHVLPVPEQGRIALSFIDDVILVHHQRSNTTLAYDIGLRGEVVSSDGVERHFPILPPLSLARVSIPCKNIPSLSLEPDAEFATPLYASSWVVFPPNVVIDGSLGCLWTVELDIEAFTKFISNPAATSSGSGWRGSSRRSRKQDLMTLVDCLLNRAGGKPILRHYCSQLTQKVISRTMEGAGDDDDNTAGSSAPTGFLLDGCPFETLDHLVSRFVDVQKASKKKKKRAKALKGSRQKQESSADVSEAISQPYQNPFVFTMDDVYETIFSPLASLRDTRVQRFLSHIVLDYIAALKSRNLPIEPVLYELLVSSLVKAGDFSRLAAMAQARALIDSKLIANQLLSIESSFPTAGQLALDMLQRLGNANESIIEIFLAKGDPITALRFCKGHPELLCLPETPRKILDAAKALPNGIVFYSVFRFFEQAVPVLQDKKYKPYIAHFTSLFGSESLSKAF